MEWIVGKAGLLTGHQKAWKHRAFTFSAKSVITNGKSLKKNNMSLTSQSPLTGQLLAFLTDIPNYLPTPREGIGLDGIGVGREGRLGGL